MDNASSCGLTNNASIVIVDVEGNTAANVNALANQQCRMVSNLSGNTFNLLDCAGNNVAGNGAFSSGSGSKPRLGLATAYSLKSHPVVWLDGAGGTLTAAQSNTGSNGRANAANPPFVSLGNVVGAYESAYGSNWGADVSRGSGWNMTGTQDSAIHWLATGNSGDLTAARWGIDNISQWGGSLACDEKQNQCGNGTNGLNYTGLNGPALMAAYSIIRPQLTAAEVANFDDYILNDKPYTQGGIDTTTHSATPFSNGAGTVTSNGTTTLTGSGTSFTSAVKATGCTDASPGNVIVLPSSQGGYPVYGMVASVQSDTQLTTCYPVGSYSNQPYWIASGWNNTSHSSYYGMVWYEKHLNASMLCGGSQCAANYPTEGGIYPFSGNYNLAITLITNWIHAGIATCQDDARGCILLEQAYEWWYDLTYPYLLSTWTGYTEAGYNYSPDRVLWMDAAITVAIRNSFVNGPDLTGGNWLRHTAMWWPMQDQPNTGGTGSVTGYGELSGPQWWDVLHMQALPLYLYLFSSTSEAAYANYWLRNYSGYWTSGHVQTGGGAWIPLYYIFADPAQTAADPAGAQTAYAFNQSDASTCSSVFGPSNCATGQYNYAVSKTGFTAADTGLYIDALSNSYGTDHSGYDLGNEFLIKRNVPLMSGDNNSSSPCCGPGYGSGTGAYGGNGYIEIGGSDTRMNNGAQAIVAVPRWTDGTNEKAANTFAYALVDATGAYTSSAHASRVQRHLAHLKKAGTQDYVLEYVDVALSSAASIRSYYDLALNSCGSASGSSCISANLSAGTFSNTQPNARLNTAVIPISTLSINTANSSAADGSYGGGRGYVWQYFVGPSSSGTAGEWASVYQPSTATSTTMPGISEPSVTATGGSAIAIQVADATSPKVVVFARQGTTLTAASLTTTHSGTAQYLIAGLTPGSYTVTLNGSAIAGSPFTVAANDNTLYFEGGSGVYLVSAGGSGGGQGGGTTQQPTISAFTTTPSTINSGQSATLSWAVAGNPAPVVSISGGLLGTITSLLGSVLSISPTTTTTYTLTATNSAGSATATVTVAVSTAATPPTVPTNLSASALSPSQVALSWTASTDPTGVAGYRIYRNAAQVATTATTAWADSNLSAATTYAYAVAAYDAAGNVSSQSASVAVTTSVDPPGAMIGTCAVFPSNNVWNTPINNLPVDANSSAYVNTIGSSTSLHPDFSSTGGGIPYNIVPASQPRVSVSFNSSQNDAGPYPIPPNALVESGSDQHVIVVDEGNCKLYELWAAALQSNGSWTAGSGAVFDLNSNIMRPSGWTSADAAGLPILPGLVRYEEVAAGQINHALRLTAPQTLNQFNWPARHFASSLSGSQYPPLGERFRLKASFDVTPYSAQVQVILKALKTYGAILADNGSSWYLTGSPDPNWNDSDMHTISQIVGSDMEAVNTSSLEVDPNSAAVSGSPTAISGIYLDQLQVSARATVNAIAVLTAPAPSGGATVTIASSSPSAASAPATVTIPAGATSAPVGLTINSISNNMPVVLSSSYLSVTQPSPVLFVNGTSGATAPLLSALAISPTTVSGGISTNGTVTLTSAAPASGTVVSLSSSDSTIAAAPASITVPSGATSAPFSVTAYSHATTETANISATLNGENLAVPVTVLPGTQGIIPTVSSFTAAPGSIMTGQSATLTWTVSGSPAPTVSINNGVGTVTGSSASVSPKATTTYTLTASNSAGSATATATVTVIADTTPPSVPTGLTAIVISSSQINLSWTASTDNLGVAGYRVYRNGTQVASTSTTAYSSTGLAASTKYSFTVAAYDAAGNASGQSAAVTATTSAATQAPVVSAFKAASSAITAGMSTTLSWTVSGYPTPTVSISGVGTVTGSATTVSPTTTTTYTLTASNIGGSATATATVTVTADTTPPSVPTGLTAAVVSSTQINLSWTASTDNVGVTGYRVYRNGAQAGATSSTSFSDTGLTASTRYTYTVAAYDAAGHLSAQSAAVIASTNAGAQGSPGTISYVQSNSAVPQSPQSAVTVTYTGAQTAGDLNVVVVGWNDSTATISAITDRSGNPYTRAAGPMVISGSASQSIYYAKNIVAAAAGTNVVTISFSTAARYPDVRILEYTGADPNNPLDVAVGQAGNSASTVSGSIATTNATDLLLGANYVATGATAAGSGFTRRMITQPDGDIVEDMMVSATGSYSATAPLGSSGWWIMQMVAFRAAGSPATISYVQSNSAVPQSPQSAVTVSFTGVQAAGDLNVVVVGWNDSTATITAVTDNNGNIYARAAGPTVISGTATQSIYYARNIAGAAAGANAVEVTFSAAAVYPDVRILEYKGADPNNPLDVAVGQTGNSASTVSGSIATTNATDLLLGANYVATGTTAAGSGFTRRMITHPDGDIVEDMMVSATGSYSATAPLGSSGWWIMQMVAFRAH